MGKAQSHTALRARDGVATEQENEHAASAPWRCTTNISRKRGSCCSRNPGVRRSHRSANGRTGPIRWSEGNGKEVLRRTCPRSVRPHGCRSGLTFHRIAWANFSSTGVQKDGSGRMALIDTNILPHATGERSDADAPNSVAGCAQPLRTRNSRVNHDAGFLPHATEPKRFGARRVTDRFVPRERQGQRP